MPEVETQTKHTFRAKTTATTTAEITAVILF